MRTYDIRDQTTKNDTCFPYRYCMGVDNDIDCEVGMKKMDTTVDTILSSKEKNLPVLMYPFGPAILQTRMPDTMVNSINQAIDMVSRDPEASEMLDWSDHLVGKVEQEMIIPRPAFQPYSNWLSHQVQHYVHASFHRLGTKQKPALDIQFVSWWAVRTLAGDFNPLHFHTDCDLSIVGYLSVPDWDEELTEDEKDHYPCKGRIEFVDGRPQTFSNHRVQFRPEVGDLYIFPAWLQHTVYPFQQSKGERRSFSVNVTVRNKST